MIADRFPDHTILAEEFGEDAATRGAITLLGVRSD